MRNTQLMTVDPTNMMSKFNKDLIGFERLFDNFLSDSPLNPSNYPPYNIEKIDEDNYRVTVAMAGFSKEDISINVEDGFLVVRGSKEDRGDESNFLYRGIATRDFTLRYALGEYVEVTGAEAKDGLLHIDLKRELPEAMKPRTIEIK